MAALLQALEHSEAACVTLVISNRADAGGLDLARRAGVPTAVLEHNGDAEEWQRLLRAARTDFIVLAGFLKKVPADVVRAYAGRIINVHPALLPKFGGAGMYGLNVHRAVLAAGERESGATVHLVTEGYDEGPVLAQAKVPVLPGDTAEQLAARVLEVEHELLPQVVLAAATIGGGRAVPVSATASSTSPVSNS